MFAVSQKNSRKFGMKINLVFGFFDISFSLASQYLFVGSYFRGFSFLWAIPLDLQCDHFLDSDESDNLLEDDYDDLKKKDAHEKDYYFKATFRQQEGIQCYDIEEWFLFPLLNFKFFFVEVLTIKPIHSVTYW